MACKTTISRRKETKWFATGGYPSLPFHSIFGLLNYFQPFQTTLWLFKIAAMEHSPFSFDDSWPFTNFLKWCFFCTQLRPIEASQWSTDSWTVGPWLKIDPLNALISIFMWGWLNIEYPQFWWLIRLDINMTIGYLHWHTHCQDIECWSSVTSPRHHRKM
jgi:hypothetical protein